MITESGVVLTAERGLAPEPLVRKVLMVVALLIVLLRLLSPFQVGSDQATQIEAGQRFASGLGITSTNTVSNNPDLVVQPTPEPLTWWAPGFSIVIAALLAIGLPLLAALKILFAGTTLIGWFGWARLAEQFLRPIEIGARRVPLHLVLAAVMPLVLTPRWSRSDLFLWAGVPFLVLLLAHKEGPGLWKFDIGAGCVLGILIGFRYAGVFLVPAVGLMLIQYCWPDWKAMFRRGIAFSVGALVFLIPLLLFLRSASESQGGQVLPAVAAAGGETVRQASIWTALGWVMEQLPAVWNVFPGFSLIGAAAMNASSLAVHYAVGLIGVAAILYLLWSARYVPARALAFSMAFIPVSLIVFLAVVNKGLFLSVKRYYDPAVLPAIFLLFATVAAAQAPKLVRFTSGVLTGLTALYLLLYIPVNVAWSAARRAQTVEVVLGYTPPRQPDRMSTSLPVRFPDASALFSTKEGTRRRMFELHQANPEALWFVQQYGMFVYDSMLQANAPRPGLVMRTFPPAHQWRTAFTSKALQAFFVLHGKTNLTFIPEDNRRVVYEDKWEQSRIVSVNLPAGYTFKADTNVVESPIPDN